MAEKPVHASVYLLCDHLDRALAAGEDLLATRLAVRGGAPADDIERHRALVAFVTACETHELMLTARLLQARKKAEEVQKVDGAFGPFVRLLVGSTALLADFAAEADRATYEQRVVARDPLTFLRSRGLISDEAAGIAALAPPAVDDDYRVAGGIPLGGLLDMVAAFLDSLERVFELFPEPETTTADPEGPAVATDESRATDQRYIL
jgi:hypothetical protein